MTRSGQAPSLTRLFFNHMDAWQVALTIALLALLIHDAFNRQTFILLLAIGLGYWLAFALNDYFDAPYDAADSVKARRNFFTQVRHLRRRFKWPVLLLVVAFLIFAFAQFGRRGWLLLALALFIMWAYSAPPLRFKNRPGWDLLIHALFVQTFPYLICLLLIGVRWIRLDAVILTITFLASLAAQLEQQLRDFKLDAYTGGNFATLVGRARTHTLLRLVTVALVLVAAVHLLNGTIPLFLLPIGIIALPALSHRFTRGHKTPRSERLVALSTTAGFLYAVALSLYTLLN